MGRNILAIIAIFLCTAFARMILGVSITARTNDSGSELGPCSQQAMARTGG